MEIASAVLLFALIVVVPGVALWLVGHLAGFDGPGWAATRHGVMIGTVVVGVVVIIGRLVRSGRRGLGGAVSVWNPFLGAETAANYARARPDYHPAAVAAAVRCLDLRPPLARAVDVGCGTGMSSRALAAIAHQVVALDVSRPMLQAAEPLAGVHHLQAAAERLPLATASADLVVTAAAFHWFDQQAMLAEARRVLVPGGALVVYTDYFAGRLRGADDCAAWLVDTYRTEFPAPARRPQFDGAAAEAAGFRYVGEERLDHDVPMTAQTLTDYLLSQSNATSAIDSGRWTFGGLRDRLRSELGQRLPPGGAAAVFTGIVRCCRRGC